MHPHTQPSPGPDEAAAALALQWVDLQDDLLTACNDLERLQGLVSSTARELGDALQQLQAGLRAHGADAAQAPAAGALAALEPQLARFVTVMQFDDMATQLLTHTRRRLRSRADRIAALAFGDDGEGALVEDAPQRPNPVTQDEMDAGTVELF